MISFRRKQGVLAICSSTASAMVSGTSDLPLPCRLNRQRRQTYRPQPDKVQSANSLEGNLPGAESGSASLAQLQRALRPAAPSLAITSSR
jgi:hypothetical protein